MSRIKWSLNNKKKFLSQIDKGDSPKTMARRWDIGVDTVHQYRIKFRRELEQKAMTSGERVNETRTRLADFDPNLLRKHREAKGFSLSRLSQVADVSFYRVWNFEDPTRPDTPYTDSVDGELPVLDRITRALGIEASDLQRKKGPTTSHNPVYGQIDRIEKTQVELNTKLDKLITALGGLD